MVATTVPQTSTTGRKVPISAIAAHLSIRLSRPVQDKTSLAGIYDFNLTWDDSNGPSLVTALQEQLGLRLDSQDVPSEVLIIDQASKPSPN